MSYAVEILRSAQTQLAKIDREDRLRIIVAIRELGNVPRPPGCKKLGGRPAWRIRVGVYRVIYEVHDDRLRVLVVRIGHRRDVYR
ncbi:MAG: type II toxin-antitoxin system RelE/ParE family toxin [Thermoguttaceae bacterium]